MNINNVAKGWNYKYKRAKIFRISLIINQSLKRRKNCVAVVCAGRVTQIRLYWMPSRIEFYIRYSYTAFMNLKHTMQLTPTQLTNEVNVFLSKRMISIWNAAASLEDLTYFVNVPLTWAHFTFTAGVPTYT